MRERLLKYIEENGVTQVFIAKKIGVGKSMLNMYIKNKRELSQNKLEKLNKYLASKNS